MPSKSKQPGGTGLLNFFSPAKEASFVTKEDAAKFCGGDHNPNGAWALPWRVAHSPPQARLLNYWRSNKGGVGFKVLIPPWTLDYLYLYLYSAAPAPCTPPTIPTQAVRNLEVKEEDVYSISVRNHRFYFHRPKFCRENKNAKTDTPVQYLYYIILCCISYQVTTIDH
jgi:hypothetical protein